MKVLYALKKAKQCLGLLIPSYSSRAPEIVQGDLRNKKLEVAILKPFENPSAFLEGELSKEQLEKIYTDVKAKFLAGYNTVAIDIGVEDAATAIERILGSSDRSIGCAVNTFLWDKNTIERLSKDTGRAIQYKRGIKHTGEDKVDFMTVDEQYSALGLKEVDSYYVILVASRKVKIENS